MCSPSEMLRSAGRPRHLHVAAPLPLLPDPGSGAVPEYPISLKKPAPRIPVGLPHRISRRLPPALPRRNSIEVGITPQPQKPAQIKTGRLLFLRSGRSNPLNLRVILRVILRTLLYQLPVSDANAIPPIFFTGGKSIPRSPFSRLRGTNHIVQVIPLRRSSALRRCGRWVLPPSWRGVLPRRHRWRWPAAGASAFPPAPAWSQAYPVR